MKLNKLTIISSLISGGSGLVLGYFIHKKYVHKHTQYTGNIILSEEGNFIQFDSEEAFANLKPGTTAIFNVMKVSAK